MKILVIDIDKEDIDKQRYSLISRSLSLGLAELGYPNVSINSLKEKDGRIRFEIKDNS